MGLAVFDTELRFQHVNRTVEAMNGLPGSAHVGRRPSEVLPGVNSEQMEAAMRRVLVTGGRNSWNSPVTAMERPPCSPPCRPT
ncbi:PAS domain-containing protein [Streptomyces sp. NPDC054833]